MNDESAASTPEAVASRTAGKILSEARIAQGLSVADVAGRIKFAPRQVEALEADDFEHLPELAFVRGFARSYAKLLQLDESEILAALPPHAQQTPTLQKNDQDVPFPTPQSERRLNVVWLSAALGLAVILAGAVLIFHNKPKPQKLAEDKQPPVAAIVTPAIVESSVAASSSVGSTVDAKTAAKPVSSVASTVNQHISVIHGDKSSAHVGGKGAIHLVFHTESWVEITDKTEANLMHQVNQPDTERWVDGTPPFSVVIGNASGVELYYEGEKINLPEYTKVEVARLILE